MLQALSLTLGLSFPHSISTAGPFECCLYNWKKYFAENEYSPSCCFYLLLFVLWNTKELIFVINWATWQSQINLCNLINVINIQVQLGLKSIESIFTLWPPKTSSGNPGMNLISNTHWSLDSCDLSVPPALFSEWTKSKWFTHDNIIIRLCYICL